MTLGSSEDVAFPANERISIGFSAHKADVVVDGKVVEPVTPAHGAAVDLFHVSPEAKATRISATTLDEDVCSASTEDVDGQHPATRVWVSCSKRADCTVQATVLASPEPILITWTHSCEGVPHPGANLGSQESLADIAKAGLVSADWAAASPLVSLGADVSSTRLYLQPKAGEEDVVALAAHVEAEPKDVVRFHAYGTLDRDRRDVYRRHGVRNVALFRPATKSSELCGHHARRAVDGIRVGDDAEVYVAMTGEHGLDPEPWLEVDLGKDGAEADVLEVRVWNREDGGPVVTNRLFPCWVMFFDGDTPPPRDLQAARKAAVAATRLTRNERLSVWTLDAPVRARWVRVQLERTTYLQVAELEVFAAAGAARCPHPVPPAVRGAATCYRATATTPQHLDLVYECLRPGEVTVAATVPLYPPFGPWRPLEAAWRKSCTNVPHQKLSVGFHVGTSEIVRGGVTQAAHIPAGIGDPTADWLGGRGIFDPSPAEAAAAAAGVAEGDAADNADADADAALEREEGVAPSEDVSARALRHGRVGGERTVEEALAANAHIAEVGGDDVETILYLQMSALGSAMAISPPEVSLGPGGADIMSPTLAGRLRAGGQVTDQSKTLRIRWGCRAAGSAVVTVAFRAVPHLQPHGPAAFAFRKTCGGRRTDMDVFQVEAQSAAAAAAEDDDALLRPEPGATVARGGLPDPDFFSDALRVPGPAAATGAAGGAPATPAATGRAGSGRATESSTEAGTASSKAPAPEAPVAAPVASGVATEEAWRLHHVLTASAASPSSRSGTAGNGSVTVSDLPAKRVGADESRTVFFVSVPPTEAEIAAGHTERQPVECAHNSDKNCTQLAHDGGGVQAWCTPNICASSWTGFGDGPELHGELVGRPLGDAASPTAKPSLVLSYHCTGIGDAVVTVLLWPDTFSTPSEFTFVKECYTWTRTWWAMTLFSSLGLAAVGGAVFFFVFRGKSE